MVIESIIHKIKKTQKKCDFNLWIIKFNVSLYQENQTKNLKRMKIVYFDFVNDKGAVTKKEFDNIIKNLEEELLPYVVEVRFKSFGTSAFKNIIIKSK